MAQHCFALKVKYGFDEEKLLNTAIIVGQHKNFIITLKHIHGTTHQTTAEHRI